MPAVLLCYLALTSFIYVKIYSAYKIIKHTRKKSYILSTNEARSYEKGFKTFIYLSLIATIVIIFIRKLSIWTILAPILNLFYFNEVLTDDLPPDYGIRETFSYLDLREKLTKKAIKMQIKWSFILASILAFIGSVMLSGIYSIRYANNEKDIMIVIVIISLIFCFIWNLIVKIVISLFSKQKEKTLNRAFNLNMGEWKDSKSEIISETCDIRVLYNYGIMYYKISVIPCIILILLFVSKFDIPMTIIITTIYTFISSLLEYSSSDSHGRGSDLLSRKTAWIKDKAGNTIGSVDYR